MKIDITNFNDAPLCRNLFAVLRIKVFVIFVLCMNSLSRADLIIDFEQLPGMLNSPGLVPAASRLSDQYLTTHGAVFNSTANYVAVVNLGNGHATSGTRGIGGVTSSNTLSYGQPIFARFFLPSNPSIEAVTSFVSVRADQNGVNGTITLEAYDINGSLLGFDTEIDNDGPLLSVSFAAIHSVKLSASTSNVAYDDFSFGTLSAVPEPSALATMSAVLMLVVARRKRWTCNVGI